MKAATSTTNRAFYILIAVVAIGGIAALTYASTRTNATTNVSPIDTTLPPVQSAGYVMGSATAPVEVTEFGDFECPQCSRFATLAEPDVRARLVNTGQIRFRFIDFPLGMHRNTWNASRAAACADQQGKFWEMHDALYQTQDQWNGEITTNPDKFFKQQLAKQVGLNADQFAKCVDTKAMQAKVQAHYKLAVDRHVNATPTFYIGDKSHEGVLSYDEFKAEVAKASAAAGHSAAGVGGDTAKGATAAKPKP